MTPRFLAVALWVLSLGSVVQASNDARSKVQFVAVNSTRTLSVPWPSSGKPIISFPFNEKNRPTGLAIFEGHARDLGEGSGMEVIGGTILVQPSHGKKAVLRDVWSLRLVEIGLVDLSGQGDDEIYFVSMEGTAFETWHFNLFNPKKLALVSLSYGWGHRDTPLTRDTSPNFAEAEFKMEREFLEGVTKSEKYGIPYLKQ